MTRLALVRTAVAVAHHVPIAASTRPDGSTQLDTFPASDRAVTVAVDGAWIDVTRWTEGEAVGGETFDDVAEAAGYITDHLQPQEAPRV
jgi:hypothetical protein